jgi:predicted RND superfamily exporter protein
MHPRVLSNFTRIAAWLSSHRRGVLLLALAVALASAVLASRLPIRSDFADLLPPGERSVRELRAIEARTHFPSTFMIGIEADVAADRQRAFESLHAKLATLPSDQVDVITVDEGDVRRFVWQHRFLFASKQDLEDARDAMEEKLQALNPFYSPLEDEPKDADPFASLQKRLDEAKSKVDSPSLLVSPDGRLQLVILRSTYASESITKGRTVDDELRARLDAVHAEVPGATLGMTGDALTQVAENQTLLRGMLRSTVITVVLVLVALLLFYRTALGVGALFFSLTVATLVTFAFTELTIGHLNLASAFLSSIVVGNGINFGMVLLARYLEERRAGRVGVDAIAKAMSATAPGTIAAAGAAAVAYGSLASTPFRGFRDFGIIGGVGMLLCWIASYTVFPAALAVIDRRVHVGREPRLGRLLGHLVTKSPFPVAFAGVVLFVAAAACTVRYLADDPLEDNMNNMRSSNAELEAAQAWMSKFDRAFGRGIAGGFAFAVQRREDAPAIAGRLRGIDEGKPENARLFSRIMTLDDVLPADQQAKLEILADIRRMLDRTFLPRASREQREKLLELRPPDDLHSLGDADVPRELAWPFTERDGTRGRIVLANTGLGVDTWSAKGLTKLTHTIRGMQLGPGVLVGGTAFVFHDMLDTMERDGPRATALAAIGSLVVVLLAVGFGRFGAVTAACGTLGTLGLLSVASFIGLKVNFLDFVALPITIGIGIDYAVNIASRARKERGDTRLAVERTGAAVLLCSYTTVVGYASLLSSANRGIRTFGLSAMIGELTCISTALVFAPAFLGALARLLEKRTARATRSSRSTVP